MRYKIYSVQVSVEDEEKKYTWDNPPEISVTIRRRCDDGNKETRYYTSRDGDRMAKRKRLARGLALVNALGLITTAYGYRSKTK